MPRTLLVAVVSLFTALAGLPAHAAAAESVRSEYVVSIYGIVIARSRFTSTISSDRFDVDGSLSSAGLATIFDDTKGTTSVKGRFARGAAQPDSYNVVYTSGKKRKNTAIAFSGGRVVKAVNTPPVNTRREGWVPVAKSHLAAVADPLSAALVPAGNASNVCGRTLRIFDGAMVADLRLSPAGNGKIDLPGYSGPTVTCAVRFVPVSGYRKGHRSIDYLTRSNRIRIAFAPVGETGIYAPVEASVPTKVGMVRVRARRFETVR